ncbi:MAG: PhnD/SsuA/transferrin family substrate-binding protein [Planctomycetes bacterium]|nr:PhnD/SsuA/transferrin family substrate-binding protein [Planctomycetota bacterium]MCB9884117.1 PhnD/SsuA/transferrin family substrate-binding protein [Planctomycetota bacterium]
MRIAELPWYDLPEVRVATDAWWRGLVGHLRRLGVDDVPDELTRGGSHVERWQQRDLLLSQSCGYDVLYDAAHAIVPIATPCYAAPGCEGPRYSSEVLVHADAPFHTVEDLRGARAAVNEPTSHSGNNAMRPLVAARSERGAFFGEVVLTGSHATSLLLLQNDKVDVACVDAVVLALLRRRRPLALHGLRTVARSTTAPAPPYVTSVHTPPSVRDHLREALFAAVRDPQLAAARDELLLTDFVALPAEAYRELQDWEHPALIAGYRELPAPRRSPLSGGG